MHIEDEERVRFDQDEYERLQFFRFCKRGNTLHRNGQRQDCSFGELPSHRGPMPEYTLGRFYIEYVGIL